MAHQTLEKLARERQGLLELLAGVSEAMLERKQGDGWSVRDILTHIVNAEEDHCQVIALLARGEGEVPNGFSLDEHNARRLAERGTLTREQLLAALVAQRGKTEALFESLSEAELAREGMHPALGTIAIGKIFRVIGLHEKMHLQDIAAALRDDGDVLS